MVDFARNKSLSGGKPPEGDEGPSLTDVVGQEELKRALLAVGASDALSGLLIRGEKGTAKSTAVRALADLLPEQRIVADCPFGCHPEPDADPAAPPQCPDCRARVDPPVGTRPTPLVTLPLGATRDRLVGTLSVADALEGEATFDPGLLARANRGVLYVDEVNLLDDHLVDALLDAAASGVNRVERDGVSVRHPAAFTLVGTMNPEEGDLRPQFRDRFDLQATVTGLDDTDDRVRVLRGALARDRGEAASTDETAGADADHAADLRRARERLAADEVHLPDEFAAEVAECCRDAGVDGHRADIATARAALAVAALDDRSRVLEPDVRRAAELALPHRLRSTPFEDAPEPEDLLDERRGATGPTTAREGRRRTEATPAPTAGRGMATVRRVATETAPGVGEQVPTSTVPRPTTGTGAVRTVRRARTTPRSHRTVRHRHPGTATPRTRGTRRRARSRSVTTTRPTPKGTTRQHPRPRCSRARPAPRRARRERRICRCPTRPRRTTGPVPGQRLPGAAREAPGCGRGARTPTATMGSTRRHRSGQRRRPGARA